MKGLPPYWQCAQKGTYLAVQSSRRAERTTISISIMRFETTISRSARGASCVLIEASNSPLP